MAAMMARVAAFAIARVGCGYLWGATGWVSTPARRQQQAAQYPAQAAMLLGEGAKWDGVPCYDCAQLVRAAVAAGGGSLPSGASSQWRAKDAWQAQGGVGTLPDMPGALLYRGDGQTMQHTGVYIGGGEAVDARGTAQGVVRGRLDAYGWTHWGLPLLPNAEEETAMEGERMTVWARQGGTVNLRAQADGGARVLARVPLGAAVQALGEAAAGWRRVLYEGQMGYMQGDFLRGEAQAAGQVLLRLDAAVAQALRAALDGAEAAP